MNCRNIEALNAQGRCGQRERAFELKQRLVGAVIRIARTHHVAHEGMTGIALGGLEQMALLATLRTMKMALMPAFLGEPRPQELSIGKVDGHVHLGRDVCRLVVLALDEAGDELLLINIEPLVEDDSQVRTVRPSRTTNHAGACDGLLAIKPYEVDVHPRGEDHLLAIIQAVDHLKPAF